MLAWMAWTWQTALFFCLVALALIILTCLRSIAPRRRESAFFAFRPLEAIGSSSP